MLVVVRADASPNIGGGHIMRCLTLANTLSGLGWKIVFCVRSGTLETVPILADSQHSVIQLEDTEALEPEEIQRKVGRCDWLIVDHYKRSFEFEQSARAFAHRILAIDDLACRKHNCDVLIDQTLNRSALDYKDFVPNHAKILAGTEYALLRPQFTERRSEAFDRRQKTKKVERLLISLGASDPNGSTQKVLQAIHEAAINLHIDIALGSNNPETMGLNHIVQDMQQPVVFHDFRADIADLILSADFAVGAAGSTSWERCCLGLPTATIVTADNQLKISTELEEIGAVKILGNAANLTVDVISHSLKQILQDEDGRARMSHIAFNVCDGNGAARVAAVLCSDLGV